MDVLELFGAMRRPLRAIEISRSLGLHPSSANQILKTMLESSHLIFDAKSKTYMPSPRFASFSAWMIDVYGVEENLRNLMNELHLATGGLVTLSTPNGTDMQIVDFIGLPLDDETTARGLRISIFGSNNGTAFLSMLKDEEILYHADRARIKSTDIRAILSVVKLARKDGFVCSPGPGGRIWALVIPLPATLSSAPLVLGISGSREYINGHRTELHELMLSAVERWIPSKTSLHAQSPVDSGSR